MWKSISIGLATVLLTVVAAVSGLILNKTWSNSEDLSALKVSVAGQKEDLQEIKDDVKEVLRRLPVNN